MYLPCRHRLIFRNFLVLTLLVLLLILYLELPLINTGNKIQSVTHSLTLSLSKDKLSEPKPGRFVSLEIGNRPAVKVNNNNNVPSATTEATATRQETENEEEDEWELLDENVPDLSILLGNKKNGPKQYSPKCAKFPNLFTVQFSNIHWQVQETTKEVYYLYSAYLDIRGKGQETPEEKLNGVLVRVLAMSDGFVMNQNNMTLKACQYWFENKAKPVFGSITETKMLWNYKWGRKGHYYPYLITCDLPPNLKEVPVSISLVTDRCDNATNNLNIMHRHVVKSSGNITPPKDFGVCVKALDFPDGDVMQNRLVEWIEMLQILGADKIFFYEYYVDPDIRKILQYYESEGIIDVQQTTLPGELPNHPQLRHLYIRGKKLDKRLTELIPYNDCLYRHMYEFKYILVIDTDELIVPQEKMSWSELLEVIYKNDLSFSEKHLKPVTTYCFRNYYFLDGMLSKNEREVAHIPPEFHMLRHVYRSTESTGTKYMKCFHKTDSTYGVHNHFAFFCRDNKPCKRHYVKLERAQMNHYRSSCVNEIKNCSQYMQNTYKDEKIWRYQDQLIDRVYSVLHNVA